jgi:hypothetical protein
VELQWQPKQVDNAPLPGAWRGIYRYYYDTQQPELTPWEMLGFTIKPIGGKTTTVLAIHTRQLGVVG